MALNIIHFERGSTQQWGIVEGHEIIPIPDVFRSTNAFLNSVDLNYLKQLRLKNEAKISLNDVRLLSPITRDQQFICQGANYRQHMIDSGVDPDAKKYNMIFTKAPGCIVSADHPVVIPRQVRLLDYEIELGLVLKKDITAKTLIKTENLHEVIAGIVIVNDYSARDIQIPQMQFYKGKSFRTFGPIGPYLCLLESDDFHYLSKLDLHLTVNGKTRQKDSTGNMIYKPEETLTELSGVQDMFRGDLIATGTPAGCALSIPSPRKQRISALLPEKVKWNLFLKGQAQRSEYLKFGDVVQASIKSSDGKINLGLQRNLVIDEGQ